MNPDPLAPPPCCVLDPHTGPCRLAYSEPPEESYTIWGWTPVVLLAVLVIFVVAYRVWADG